MCFYWSTQWLLITLPNAPWLRMPEKIFFMKIPWFCLIPQYALHLNFLSNLLHNFHCDASDTAEVIRGNSSIRKFISFHVYTNNLLCWIFRKEIGDDKITKYERLEPFLILFTAYQVWTSSPPVPVQTKIFSLGNINVLHFHIIN